MQVAIDIEKEPKFNLLIGDVDNVKDVLKNKFSFIKKVLVNKYESKIKTFFITSFLWAI